MSIKRPLSDDSYEAAEGATGQSATNPFATESVTNSLQSQISALAPGNAVLTGGVSYSGTGFIYDVSALTYRIAGNLYTSALTQVTLNAADPTFGRIDIIYADDNGLVGKITGTPSASPVKPQVDNATQVEVSFVTVGAGATAPSGLTIVDVYLEDAGTPTEWAGTSDFGANFAATADPHSGTKHIDTGAGFVTPNKEMIFTPLAPYTINGGNLNFWLNPQVSLSGPQQGFFVGFYVSGGLVGNSVQIAGVPFITYGFDPLAPLNVYQLVSIPISAFGALPATIDELRMFKTAGPPSATDMYIDDIQIQEGIPASGGGSIDATAVTYTPTTPGDWGPVPDDVAEALDQLAAGGGGGLPNRVISWSFNGVYSNSNTSFASIPEQIQVPTAAELGGTTIQAILIVSYNTTGASTGEFRLFNYTDSVSEGFVTAVPNGTWVKGTSVQAAITEGKAYRVDLRRVGGTGGDAMQLESATLILIVS